MFLQKAAIVAGLVGIALCPLNSVPLSSKTISKTCKSYKRPSLVALLNHKKINESSGLALSSQYPNRFYHTNDSGDKARLYVTHFNHQTQTTPLLLKTETLKIDGWNPIDAEALAYGPCPTQQKNKCIYIGDIGDNSKKRKYVEIIVIQEQKSFPKKIRPLLQKKLIYTDGAKNAEGMALHPLSGDLFILSKDEDLTKMKAYPSQIIKISAQQFLTKSRFMTGENWGEINTPSFTSHLELWGQITTGMDIHPSGKSFVFSTYKKNILVNHDLNSSPLPPTKALLNSNKLTLLEQLAYPQIESVAFSLDGESIYNTSEYHKDAGLVPLTKSNCSE